jgi:hypothetical protein
MRSTRYPDSRLAKLRRGHVQIDHRLITDEFIEMLDSRMVVITRRIFWKPIRRRLI